MIRARYRVLVKLHHPDKGGDDAAFNRIQEAHDRAMRSREA